ncbi:phytanoyl-CoA dioxygenase family protein [Sneathiella sp. HT1-7]|uniref:phytanoyl-CoA dioxygenase family protein n=1 Tax=Sneathiella sp. HT1-7 TaxID=2887192 RepID=UPI001D14B9DE|nr:phytanoyl-CoA dioxygenase family protein [Sneathiella sp. HT1-7]MCC3306338.1 phytanoyl-CoA dioxygenase family protein [Sneathiella sp. HT1-7]
MVDRDYTKSIEACAAHYGEEAESVKAYMHQGHERAYALGNRGPIRFNSDGSLAQEILDAYSKYGFYVFEEVLQNRELKDIEEDIAEMRTRFPVHRGAKVDSKGRAALDADCEGSGLLWSKPLSDPFGGTNVARGRHQVKLKDLNVAPDAPEEAPFILVGSLQFSEAHLRLYAHPELLKVAEAVNGEDFAPFNEVMFIKDPGLGAAVSWHQDGDTHWDSPEFDENIHGFNFMAQLYGSTPVNGVWVVPGTHKMGKLDITEMVRESGGERLKDAVPIVCDPGDVVMCNRQLVHGSFPNSGFEPRLTLNFGFHKRSSVLDVQGAGIHSPACVYDAEYIKERTRVLGYAIDARRHWYPDETPYDYKPFKETGESFFWDCKAQASLKDYNQRDLSI